jgi:O-antigen/teichoic acid export membrane protein
MTEPDVGLPPSIGDRAARGLVWVAFERYGQQAITFFTFVVLSRILAPTAFGFLAMGVVYTTLVEELIDLGMGPALVQRAQLDDRHRNTAFVVNVVIGFGFAALGWMGGGLVAALYRQPDLTPVIQWLSLGFAVEGAIVTQEALLRRELKFRVLTTRGIAAAIMGSIAAIVAASMGAGLWSLVILQLTKRVAGFVVLWSASTWRPRLQFSQHHLAEILGFGWYMLGSRLLTWVSQRSDDLMIGLFLGPQALGFYGMGYRGFNLLTAAMSGVMNTVVFPALSELQADRPRFLKAFRSATTANALVVLPVFAALALFGNDVVRVLFGAEWAPAGPVLRVLSLIGVAQAVVGLTNAALLALGRSDLTFRIGLASTFINVVGFAVAVRWGITAVATAFVVRAYLLSPLGLLALRRVADLRIRDHLGLFVGPIAATLVAVVAASATVSGIEPQSAWARLIVGFSVGGVAYVGAAYAFAPSIVRDAAARVRRALPKRAAG